MKNKGPLLWASAEIFSEGQRRHFVYPSQIAGSAMQTDVHKTLYPFSGPQPADIFRVEITRVPPGYDPALSTPQSICPLLQNSHKEAFRCQQCLLLFTLYELAGSPLYQQSLSRSNICFQQSHAAKRLFRNLKWTFWRFTQMLLLRIKDQQDNNDNRTVNLALVQCECHTDKYTVIARIKSVNRNLTADFRFSKNFWCLVRIS